MTPKKKKKITPREKQYAHINTLLWHRNLSSWTANPSKTDLEEIRQCTPLTFTYFLPPCVSAQTGCPVGQRQLSAPWTGLALQEATTALYLTSKWLASWPQRLPTCMQNYCGTRGNYCTVHCPCLCSESGLLCYYYCNCHCCRLVCSGEAETLWLVCWMGFVQNVVGNVLGFFFFFCPSLSATRI